MTNNWNVIIVKRRCPHKYHEMHDSIWSEVCELTRKPCNIENCPKKEGEFAEKVLKEKEDHEFDYDYNCIKCGKNLLELVDRTYLTTEFDTHDTHKIVSKANLEGWKNITRDICKQMKGCIPDNGAWEWFREKQSVLIQDMEKYLREELRKEN